jgi:predicted phage terminase large subunit-like protein
MDVEKLVSDFAEAYNSGEITPMDMIEAGLDVKTIEKITELAERLKFLDAKEKATTSLKDYILYTKEDYDMNWHHELICDAIDDFLDPSNTKEILVLQAGPRQGKLLSHSTPVLTTDGWKNHGDIRVGDFVFHPSGKPVEVLAISGEDVADYEVEFTNGEKIRCHGNHEWTFDVYGSSDRRKTYETREFVSPVSSGRRKGQLRQLLSKPKPSTGKRDYVYRCINNECLSFDEKELPIDPYFLGVWLGDGCASEPRIHHSQNDTNHIRKISEKYGVSTFWIHKETEVQTTSFAGNNLRRAMRDIGIHENKHIPACYITASVNQRLELLAGLIDSDGNLTKKERRYRISGINEGVINAVADIVRSLGWVASVYSEEPKVSSSGIKGNYPVFTVGFNPTFEIPVQLERKKLTTFSKVRRSSLKSVRKLEYHEVETGRCIQVDSEDGLYLAGRKLTTTHNSEIVSRRLPSYILGKNPDAPIVFSTYSADLAKKMNRDVQRIIDSPTYHDLFPDTLLNRSNVRSTAKGSYIRTTDMFEVVGKAGSYKSVGVGGPLTGFGFELGIIDDIVKDYESAMSHTVSESTWNWWQSVFYTRKAKGAKIIIMMTRWTENDLIGRLLDEEKKKGTDSIEILSFPMVYDDGLDDLHPCDPRIENGEALWPSRFPEDECMKIKNRLGSKIWTSLYQQSPIPDGGAIFNRNWFRYYRELPDFEYTFLSLDCSFKDSQTSDYVVFGIWGVKGKNKYLIDVVRERMNFNTTLSTTYVLLAKYKDLTELVIEAKANGDAIISTIDSNPRITVPVYAFNPTSSKESRAASVAPQVEAGHVYLPDVDYAENSHKDWVHLFIDEVVGFPNKKNDDQVDMFTQAIIRASSSTLGWMESILSADGKTIKNEHIDERIRGIADDMGWDIFNPNAGGFGLDF